MRLSFIVVLCIAWPASAADWCSTDGSVLRFETTFEGEPLPGEFRKFNVKLDFEPDDTSDASLCVVVDLRRADMGDPEMNDVLFDAVWLHVDKYGDAEFTSDGVRESPEGGYSAAGTLRLKGIERPVTVPFTWDRSGESAAMRGELELRRTDFDVGTGEWSTGDSIGLDVRLEFDVRLEACE